MHASLPVFALAAGALCAGCAATPPSALPETVRAAVDGRGVQHAEVVAGNYWFRPRHIIVKAGAPVRLALRKEPGMVAHDFVLKAPDARIDVAVALTTELTTVEFVPAASGRFEFHCSEGFIEPHRERGMTGVLEVVP